jgi:hypothetical protein
MKSRIVLIAIVAALAVAGTASAQVAIEDPATESNQPSLAERDSPPLAEEVDAKAIWRGQVICTLGRPSHVQGYDIRCPGASFLDVRIADCCIPGDHFQAKVKSWDNAPNTAVTTSPGPVNVFGVPARVYNYTGVGGSVHTYLECTYLHGVNIFGASAFVDLSSDAACNVIADPLRSRIDRSP